MAIDGKELKVAVKSLNEVLDKKIKVVGVKKDAVVVAFGKAVLSFIEANTADKLPDDVIDFYNANIATEEPEPEEAPAEAKPAAKGKGKKKGAAPKKPTTPKKKSAPVEKDDFSCKVGSGASKINAMLVKGASLEDMVKQCETTKSRVQSHIGSLRKKGFTVDSKDGKFSLSK